MIATTQFQDRALMDTNIEAKIRDYLAASLCIEFGGEVDDDSDLFQCGLIDSGAYIRVIRFVETEFDLRLTDEEILTQVKVSVRGIAALVTERTEQRR